MKIKEIAVREVAGGLFSLNDLHKAAGGENKDKPNHFMSSPQTVGLIGEIAKVPGSRPFRKIMGRAGGTYVCKELVYAYAMWVSPAFHLEVINSFDQSVSKSRAVMTELDKIGAEVSKSTSELMKAIDDATVTISDLKRHGSDWGSYGAAIRRVKADTTKKLNAAKAEIQFKLDLLG